MREREAEAYPKLHVEHSPCLGWIEACAYFLRGARLMPSLPKTTTRFR